MRGITWKLIQLLLIATLPSLVMVGEVLAKTKSQQQILALPLVAEDSKQNDISFQKHKQLTKRTGKFLQPEYQNSSNFFALNEEVKIAHQDIQKVLQAKGTFDRLVRDLNNLGLVMRQDIPIIFKACYINEKDFVNAYYDPNDKEIVICYQYIAQDIFLFTLGDNLPLEQAIDKSINETIFTFYHELGHALIDILPLPSVGLEEDAVDEFAAIMLLKSNPREAPQIILDEVDYFRLKRQSKSPAWDEHSPNSKRLFNLVCIVYGSNPEKHKSDLEQAFNLLANDYIEDLKQDSDIDPEDLPAILEQLQSQLNRKAALCENEFKEKQVSWNKLLLPHYATQNRGNSAASPNSPPPASRPSRGHSDRGRYW